jgi:hypothetical protein
MADLQPVCTCGAPASSYLDGWKCAMHRETTLALDAFMAARRRVAHLVALELAETAYPPGFFDQVLGDPCPAEA